MAQAQVSDTRKRSSGRRLPRVARAGLVAALVATAFAACAGWSGRVVAIQPGEMAKLSGTWQGTLVGVSGLGWPGTLIVSPDGTYAVEGGAFTADGRMALADGKLTFVSTYTSGFPTDPRTGSAVLMDAGSSWRLVGSGHSDRGPFNFDFSKPK